MKLHNNWADDLFRIEHQAWVDNMMDAIRMEEAIIMAPEKCKSCQSLDGVWYYDDNNMEQLSAYCNENNDPCDWCAAGCEKYQKRK